MEKGNSLLISIFIFCILPLYLFPAMLVAETKEPQVKISHLKGKPDPFRPFLEADAKNAREREKLQAMPLSPLQQSPLESFRLTGIAGSMHARIAIVEDRRGRFYVLRPGTYIGTDNGRVVKIHNDHVIIEERRKTSWGREKISEVKMTFHMEGREERP